MNPSNNHGLRSPETADLTPPLGFELAGFHKLAGKERKITGVREAGRVPAWALSLGDERRTLMRLTILAASYFLTSAIALADVTLPKIIGSHMVLQQGKPLNLWGSADPDETVVVRFGATHASVTADKDGKWRVQLEPQKACSDPRELKISGKNEIVLTDILVGEVWLCSGQSNMKFPMRATMHKDEEIPKADHPAIRLWQMGKMAAAQPQTHGGDDWVGCSQETVQGFSGVAYHFGEALHRELKVPIGLIQSAVDGVSIEPWTPLGGFEKMDSLKNYEEKVRALTAESRVDPGTPSALYNGMIHPLVPFALRGVIWYQGEWNCFKGDAAIYTDKSDALISGWRKAFGQGDLPFYFVQIGPMTYTEKGWLRKSRTPETLPRFWDAQRACLKSIPKSGMVVITDIFKGGDSLHPPNKRDVGRRLALWALAHDYGRQGLVHSGPLYQSMKIAAGRIILAFDHIGGGLTSSDGKDLAEFMIAGEDRKFVPARAEIKGSAVEVYSPDISQPVAVRFGWREVPEPNLANKEGLPASPFRTDPW